MQSLTVEKPAFLGFRLAQYLVYGLVLVCFVAAVAGDLAVRSFLNDPGFFPFLELVFSALIKLFSPWGLAGLGSYALINLFLGLRFYNRYKKLLRRRSRRFIETLELEFQRLWEEELEAVLFRLESLKQELDEQIATLANLETAKGS
jgi:hypothetical protein